MKHSQKGQVTVEFVLVMVILLSLALFMRKALFQDGDYLANMVSKPWNAVSAMIENGSFRGTVATHPGHLGRHLSVRGIQE